LCFLFTKNKVECFELYVRYKFEASYREESNIKLIQKCNDLTTLTVMLVSKECSELKIMWKF
jgi:hypothetical protein